MSIRLASGGLSFYIKDPESPKAAGRHIPFARNEDGTGKALRDIIGSTPAFSDYFSAVDVYIDTVDTVYVPAEVLKAENAAVFLSEAGIHLLPGEGVAVSATVGDVRAAMKYDADALLYLRDFYGSRLSFYSPLQENLHVAERIDLSSGALIANITGKNIYITLFGSNKLMRVSEVYPYENSADIVFYLHKLMQGAGMKRPRIFLFGPGATSNCKQVKKYFPGTSCV